MIAFDIIKNDKKTQERYALFMVYIRASQLLKYVHELHPGEEFYCEYMKALETAVKEYDQGDW